MSQEPWLYHPTGFIAIGPYIEGDPGHELVRAAHEAGEVIYVAISRPWQHRLFSWPWRPWKKFISEPVPMRVTSADDGSVVFEQVT